MITFSEWLEKKHPDFNEGFLNNMTSRARKIVGASNAAIGGLGIFSRLYTPLVGAMPIQPPQMPAPETRPAIVAQADAPPVADKPKYPYYPLTGVKVFDDLGSQVGEPDSQGWYDAADMIPGAQDDEVADRVRTAKAGARRQDVTGFADPNWRPKPIKKMRRQ